jgi:hypothetical protein
VLRTVLVFHGVALLWVPFRATSFDVTRAMFERLFLKPYVWKTAIPTEWPVWIAGFFLLHPLLDRLIRTDRFITLPLRWQLAISGLLIWLMAAYSGAPVDFIYFVF